MTLLACHNGVLYADRMIIVNQSTPLERKILQPKIRISECGRFAYGVTGPSLHPLDIPQTERMLCKILMEAERNLNHFAIDGEELKFFMLGERCWMFMSSKVAWSISWLDTGSTVINDGDICASGTGGRTFITLMNNGKPLVPESEIVPTVASFISTVSKEHDIIRQSDLKPFKYVDDL